jgi:hypothetical protein
MTTRTLPFALLLAGALLVGARGAVAAPEDGEEDLKAKIKQQMEKILQLMRESEAALLEATTVGAERPAGVDVPVPPGTEAPPLGGPGATGEEVRKRLEELINGQQRMSGQIPKELEELVRMIPT